MTAFTADDVDLRQQLDLLDALNGVGLVSEVRSIPLGRDVAYRVDCVQPLDFVGDQHEAMDAARTAVAGLGWTGPTFLLGTHPATGWGVIKGGRFAGTAVLTFPARGAR